MPVSEAVGRRRVPPVELVEGPAVARRAGDGGAPDPPGRSRPCAYPPSAAAPATIEACSSVSTPAPAATCATCAREVIEAERGRTRFAFEEIDIEGDDRLELEYGIRIPVVTIDGREAFEIEVRSGGVRGSGPCVTVRHAEPLVSL